MTLSEFEAEFEDESSAKVAAMLHDLAADLATVGVKMTIGPTTYRCAECEVSFGQDEAAMREHCDCPHCATPGTPSA